MRSETLLALKKSIRHWERMRDHVVLGAKNNTDRPYAEDCALCELFIDIGCRGCPVSERADAELCTCTPYDEACRAWKDYVYKTCSGGLAKWRVAAQAEIEFLRSLLPAEGAKP